jgi:hypothetical protein
MVDCWPVILSPGLLLVGGEVRYAVSWARKWRRYTSHGENISGVSCEVGGVKVK